VDLEGLFRKGGKELLGLLSFSVCSIQLEPLFVFLAQEYRLAPTAARALALYDVFCTPESPGRIRADAVLPPYDLRLVRDTTPLRVSLTPAPPGADAPGSPPPPQRPLLPPAYLFDFVVEHLKRQTDGPLQAVAAEYDPERTPAQNLGGRLNASQRFFVDKVWQPRLRPQLTAAGFWRVGVVGG
jgi:hypothetical protein